MYRCSIVKTTWPATVAFLKYQSMLLTSLNSKSYDILEFISTEDNVILQIQRRRWKLIERVNE